jgi:pimeloyl-ACP methyl ester carboxylesterase
MTGLLSPEFKAFLESFSDGYFVPPFYNISFAFSPPEVRDFLLETQPALYPTGPFLILFTGFPYFDPGVANVPGLVIANEFETVATANDKYLLAADYGSSGAQLVIIPGAYHATRIENPQVAAAFWAAVWDFIDN